ncbi:MAG: hypothetical protein EXS12_04745 [Phycisphaerales bacterium]|nr:hypothetical protein [Phycisphaerales bacterium]
MIPSDDNHKILSEENRRAIDALLEAGLVDGDDLVQKHNESAESTRQAAALSLLRKLEAYPVSEPDTLLLDSTMARIAREERAKQDRMEIHTPSWGKRTQWADFGAVAAVALLATGVGWPIAQRMRAAALEQNCANNLRTVGSSIAAYAVDHRGNLPATASLGGLFESPAASKLDWSNYEHSGHLLLLERNGYARHDSLHCPACTAGSACGTFSFRVPSVNTPFRLELMGRTPLVADANPVIHMRRIGNKSELSAPNTQCSMNHQQRGQNVLFADVSIIWLVTPLINGDNIYLPDGVQDSQSLPLSPQATTVNDIFLAQ